MGFRTVTILIFLQLSCYYAQDNNYSVIIRNGLIYDGSGNKPYNADIGICGDSICKIGDLSNSKADLEIDANNKAVSPGFINMLSWATESLIEDGRSQSDLLQGVTLEVMGEGWSMGPLTTEMKAAELKLQGDIKYDIKWTTLGEYLNYLEEKGISTNVASFVGATTIRISVLGYDDRPPTADELIRMKDLVAEAMNEGALGLGSSLIYAPAFYAGKDELVEMAKTASEYDGMYISHLRSEGNNIFEALNELFQISREANIPAEIYHLKTAGSQNWSKADSVITLIENARSAGLRITADMYTYTAGATGLDAMMPPWVQEGGLDSWIDKLKSQEIREKVIHEINTPSDKWENFYLLAGSADNILLVSFKQDSLKYLTGKTLSEVSKIFGKSPEDAAIELVIRDHSRVGTVYFLMSDENVRKIIKQPWVSFGSDEASLSPEGVFLKSNPHPRAYGNFSRLLGRFVREEKLLTLEEAVRRLSSFPAENLKLTRRGSLKEGFYADIVVFDPNEVIDHATYDNPHQYSTGVNYVFVNGVPVIMDGVHTDARPGRFIKGPGWNKGEKLFSE